MGRDPGARTQESRDFDAKGSNLVTSRDLFRERMAAGAGDDRRRQDSDRTGDDRRRRDNDRKRRSPSRSRSKDKKRKRSSSSSSSSSSSQTRRKKKAEREQPREGGQKKEAETGVISIDSD